MGTSEAGRRGGRQKGLEDDGVGMRQGGRAGERVETEDRSVITGEKEGEKREGRVKVEARGWRVGLIIKVKYQLFS